MKNRCQSSKNYLLVSSRSVWGFVCKINRLKNLFLGNGYPEEVIVDTVNKIVNKFWNNIRPFSPSKCPVYVRLPWNGSPSQLIVYKVSSSVTHCYNMAMVQTIFTTQAAFCSIPKDVLPIFQQSNLIYKFQCSLNGTYIGCTSQRLEVKVKQCVLRDIHNRTTSGHSKLLDSAIFEHLNALNSDDCFDVLHRARTKQYLIVLLYRPTQCKHSMNLQGDNFC